jgi:hypothetical protein
MTIYSDHEKTAKEIQRPCKGIERLLEARITELGGFGVRRVLPSPSQLMVGPWIFFDHFGPTAMPPGKGVDILPHPHINMATVTYLYEGEMLHQDSTGSVQVIQPGAVNVMFAGKGIVHSERTPKDLRAKGHTIQGLQLWLAMPEAIEQDPPQFYHYGAEDVPVFNINDVTGRVLMGEVYDVRSEVITFSKTLYFEARLPSGSELTLPSDPKEIGIYVVEGKVVNHETVIEEGVMAVSTDHDGICIKALVDSKIAVVGGEPLGQRYIWWNFVSSDPLRINQAALDWQDGMFPEIPTDHEGYLHMPENK